MIKAIVTDVEGTVSTVAFVREVLLPFARERICVFLREHTQQKEVADLLAAVAREAGGELSLDECCKVLEQWMAEDRKLTPLKALQGLVWEEGYRSGKLVGQLYEDAVRNLRRWKEKGLRLYVFSSGSIQAQRQLFSSNDYGDLTPLFSAYFDSRTGHKQEVSSYEIIASEINERAGDILFLSDSAEELDAARAAGMQTRWLVRDAENVDPAARHLQVKDFDAISLD